MKLSVQNKYNLKPADICKLKIVNYERLNYPFFGEIMSYMLIVCVEIQHIVPKIMNMGLIMNIG